MLVDENIPVSAVVAEVLGEEMNSASGNKKVQTPRVPDYVGFPEDSDKLVAQISYPLISLVESNSFGLEEWRILLLYLARIDSHNPKKTYVTFTKSDLEDILERKRIHAAALDKHLSNMFTGVRINDPEEAPNGYSIIPLFEEAKVRNDKDGVSRVHLICSEKAAKYFFNVERMRYLKPHAIMLTRLKILYSLGLYFILAKLRKKDEPVTWTVKLDDLRTKLSCPASYKQYKEFNRSILKRCQEELHQKTDLRFLYEAVYQKSTDRSPTAVTFCILPTNVSNALPQQNASAVLENIPENKQETDPEVEYARDLRIDLLMSACQNEFTREQIVHLISIFSAYELHRADWDDIDEYHYLEQAYTRMNTLPNIKNRFSYLSQMLKNELGVE